MKFLFQTTINAQQQTKKALKGSFSFKFNVINKKHEFLY